MFFFEECVDLIYVLVGVEFFNQDVVWIKVILFFGFVVEIVCQQGVICLVCGLCDGIDFDYEMQMVGMNGIMVLNIQMIFLFVFLLVWYIMVIFVCQIVKMGGEIVVFVLEFVIELLCL